jgi:hypothetical protein
MARKNAKPGLPAWTLPLLSLAASLLLHAVWSLPRVRMPTAVPARPALAMTLRQVRGSDEWRPVLFSLPSPDGFSGVIRRLDTRLSPPLETPVTLIEPSPFQPLDFGETARLPDFPLREDAVTLLTPTPPEPVPQQPERGGWTLRFPDRPDLRVVLARDPRIQNPREPVRLSGDMTFDPDGRLLSLLFEPHNRSAREMDLLLPDVRQVTLPSRAGAGRYRFELEYRPPVP